jgi:hypothetical protein
VPYAADYYKRIHNCALEEFVKVGKGGSLEDIPDGMHILVLRVLNEPHCSRTHDLATATEEDGKHVPIRRVRGPHKRRVVPRITNMNIVPTTQW